MENVPQRLKPGMAVSFKARLKPCPSGIDCHTLQSSQRRDRSCAPIAFGWEHYLLGVL